MYVHFESGIYHAGGWTPAYCDASRASAGVQVDDLSQQGCVSPEASRFGPQSFQNGVNPSQNPSQIHPKSPPNRPRIHPEGLLELILDQCNEKVTFLTHKNRPKVTQSRPRDTLERPKDLPNGAPDPPKSIFYQIFEQFFR